jgi:hypothetical protein
MLNISYTQFPEVLHDATIPESDATSLEISIFSETTTTTDESTTPPTETSITTQYLQLKSIDNSSETPNEITLKFQKQDARNLLSIIKEFTKQISK